MAIALDPKQIVLNDELLLSQVISQEAIIRLLIEKGIFSKEEFLEMVNVVNVEIGKMVWQAKKGAMETQEKLVKALDVTRQPINDG